MLPRFSLGQQSAKRHLGGGLVGAGLPEETLLAGDRVGSGVDLDPERAAGRPLYGTSPGLGHNRTITRSGRFSPRRGPRYRTSSIYASELEPPIGIEPMTYALRGCHRALLAGSKSALASCSQVAAGGDRWLLTAVRGHLGDTSSNCVGQALGGVAPPHDGPLMSSGLPVRVARSKCGWMLSCVRGGGWLAPLLSPVPSSVVITRCPARTDGARSLAYRSSCCQVEADHYKTDCLRDEATTRSNPSFAEAKVATAGVSHQGKKRHHSRKEKSTGAEVLAS